MRRNYTWLFFLLILICAAPASVLCEPSIFWSDPTLNQILKSKRDGSGVTPIINLTPGENAESITIDDIGGKIYWSSLSFNRISRANLDGTNQEVVVPNASFPNAIQIEPLERKLYWAASMGGFRANLDGSGQQNILNELLSDNWRGFALEPLTKTFFLSEQLSQNITFANYNGPSFPVSELPFLQTTGAKGLTIDSSDPTNAKIYWTNPTSRELYFSNILVPDPQAMLLLDISGEGSPENIAVDFPPRFVYWTDSGNGRVVRTNLASPSEEGIVNSPSPLAIALDCGQFAPDSDSDGTPNCLDNCPSDPNKTSPGACGCNVIERDTDNDGISDCIDGCPNDAQKTTPGTCGCGLSEFDSDLDGVINCFDECPADTLKSQAGACGCGLADIDSDNDGVFDCSDECPLDDLKISAQTCGCGQRDNLTGDGKILCSEYRILSPITSIIDPPDVIVKKRSVTILMEKFAAVTDKRIKSTVSTEQPNTLEARRKKTKITSRYTVYLNRNGGVKGKKLSARTKRNTLTFKNLKPGNYSARYRVEVLKNDKVIGRTNRSPAASFTIP